MEGNKEGTKEGEKNSAATEHYKKKNYLIDE